MIVARTPLRISFLGGGTDYPEHFLAHGGRTLCASIDKFVYLTVTRLPRLFDHRIRVAYSRTELCRHVSEVQHPSVRECLKLLGIEHDVEINVTADLPARTGLGSSSSFTVGLLHALHALRGELVSREQLAAEAVRVEREMIQERVGWQDQYAAALGGLRQLTFQADAPVSAALLPLLRARQDALEARLMLLYTGIQRTAHEVLEDQLSRTQAGQIQQPLTELASLVDEATRVLVSDEPLAKFGELLHAGWQLKRKLSDKVSTPLVDQAYERARAAGAIGGKLLGAGSGGFLLLFAEPERRAAVRQALSDLREVPFRFEQEGTSLIFYRA